MCYTLNVYIDIMICILEPWLCLVGEGWATSRYRPMQGQLIVTLFFVSPTH